MLITVVNEVVFFLLLFLAFILTFAQSFHIFKVDVEVYGMLPELFGHFLAVLRSSMGDFSMIDPYQSFDLY